MSWMKIVIDIKDNGMEGAFRKAYAEAKTFNFDKFTFRGDTFTLTQGEGIIALLDVSYGKGKNPIRRSDGSSEENKSRS